MKGQLGHGELVNCLKPKFVKSFETIAISNVSAGWSHSGFVTGCTSLVHKFLPSVDQALGASITFAYIIKCYLSRFWASFHVWRWIVRSAWNWGLSVT